jgi:hypothetical protein
MGRIYSVSFAATVTSAGTDTDLLELAPAAQKPVKLRGFSLGQTSEVADAAEEGVRISILRMAATVTGSNGTSTTGIPMDSANVAAGFAAETNGTTVATTSGATVVLGEFAWNIRNSPYEVWFPDAEFAPKAKNAEFLFVRMQTTLTDDISAAMTFWIEEE